MAVSGCRKIGELLFDYIEGNLDNRIKASVEEHLAQCEACRAEAERCRATLDCLAHAKAEPPSELVSSVMAKIAAERVDTDGRSGKQSYRRSVAGGFRFRYGTVAAALVVATALLVGWRVIPAFLNAGSGRADTVQYKGLVIDQSANDTAGGDTGTITDAADSMSNDGVPEGAGLQMFVTPSQQRAFDSETSEIDKSAPETAGDNLAPCPGLYMPRNSENSSPDDIIALYAPEFAGKATGVVVFHTTEPIRERPFASARVEGEGYAAFLINDSEVVISKAESLAAALGGEIEGSRTGVGIVWIELYKDPD